MHTIIEQSSVHLPELVKDIGQPVSIYLVHLSRRPGTVAISSRPGAVVEVNYAAFETAFVQ